MRSKSLQLRCCVGVLSQTQFCLKKDQVRIEFEDENISRGNTTIVCSFLLNFFRDAVLLGIWGWKQPIQEQYSKFEGIPETRTLHQRLGCCHLGLFLNGSIR